MADDVVWVCRECGAELVPETDPDEPRLTRYVCPTHGDAASFFDGGRFESVEELLAYYGGREETT